MKATQGQHLTGAAAARAAPHWTSAPQARRRLAAPATCNAANGAVYNAGYRNSDQASDPYDNNTGQANQIEVTNKAYGVSLTVAQIILRFQHVMQQRTNRVNPC